MNCAKAIKKIEKYLGIKVEIDDHGRCWFQYEDKICSFFPNGSRDVNEGDITCMRVRRAGDEDDPYTDYCAGYFVDNVTQLIHACKPPEPKYKPGQLVRGKSTKRAQRWGFAGKVGLVTDSGSGQARVHWNGEEPTRSYFSERDLELVSG